MYLGFAFAGPTFEQLDFDTGFAGSGDCCQDFVAAVIKEEQVLADIEAQYLSDLVGKVLWE